MGSLGTYFANWLALKGSFLVFLENADKLVVEDREKRVFVFPHICVLVNLFIKLLFLVYNQATIMSDSQINVNIY